MQAAALVVGVGVVLFGFRWHTSARQIEAMQSMLQPRAESLRRAVEPSAASLAVRLLAADPQRLAVQIGAAPPVRRSVEGFAAPDWPAEPKTLHKPGTTAWQPVPDWSGIERQHAQGSRVRLVYDAASALAATAHEVDVVVFDHVPDASVFAPALQAGREQARLTRVLWIEALMSAPAAAADAAMVAVRGLSQQHMSPPFTPAALCAALQTTPPAAPIGWAAPSPVDALAGRHVLLAEDNPINHTLAATVLAQLGAEVTTAADGRQALACLAGARFDLALMDIQMPELDGSDVVRDWRAVETRVGAEALPIIAMTAHAMAGDRERLIAQGFDGYVGKPFTRERLLAEIERVGATR